MCQLIYLNDKAKDSIVDLIEGQFSLLSNETEKQLKCNKKQLRLAVGNAISDAKSDQDKLQYCMYREMGLLCYWLISIRPFHVQDGGIKNLFQSFLPERIKKEYSFEIDDYNLKKSKKKTSVFVNEYIAVKSALEFLSRVEEESIERDLQVDFTNAEIVVLKKKFLDRLEYVDRLSHLISYLFWGKRMSAEDAGIVLQIAISSELQ